MDRNSGKIELEICAYSLESCRAAQASGADRVELCASFPEGGTTPSAGLVRQARRLLDRTQLFVMIRPRGGDFLYTEEEFLQMKEEIRCARDFGADGVVLGLLLPDGRIDLVRTGELVSCAAPLPVTFHRAFDMGRTVSGTLAAEAGTAGFSGSVPEEPDAEVLLSENLEAVIEAGCSRLLTSGGRNTAPEGIRVLHRLSKLSRGRIRIMAGSGVNGSNAGELLRAGADALHLSARSVRESGMQYRNERLSMGGLPGVPEYGIPYADPAKIRSVAEEIRRYERACRGERTVPGNI